MRDVTSMRAARDRNRVGVGGLAREKEAERSHPTRAEEDRPSETIMSDITRLLYASLAGIRSRIYTCVMYHRIYA